MSFITAFREEEEETDATRKTRLCTCVCVCVEPPWQQQSGRVRSVCLHSETLASARLARLDFSHV